MGSVSRSSLAFEEAAHQGLASLPFGVGHTYVTYFFICVLSFFLIHFGFAINGEIYFGLHETTMSLNNS